MKALTKAEEGLMLILWRLEKGVVNDILRAMNNPKPAYNTVSTIIRILERKNFIKHKAYGKTFEYFPIVSKEKYISSQINNLIILYFDGSADKLIASLKQ